MDAYLLEADCPYGNILTETGCLFYTRYVEYYIPHLHSDPAGMAMDVKYLAVKMASLEHKRKKLVARAIPVLEKSMASNACRCNCTLKCHERSIATIVRL